MSARQTLVESLNGFNLGVESSQLAMVLVVPLAFQLCTTRSYRQGIWLPISAVVALVALLWFVQCALP